MILNVIGIFLVVRSVAGQATRCYVCDVTSKEGFVNANRQCNQGVLATCPYRQAGACMTEAARSSDGGYRVIKRCRSSCLPFLEPLFGHARCCRKNGCNGAVSAAYLHRYDSAPEPASRTEQDLSHTESSESSKFSDHLLNAASVTEFPSDEANAESSTSPRPKTKGKKRHEAGIRNGAGAYKPRRKQTPNKGNTHNKSDCVTLTRTLLLSVSFLVSKNV